MSATCVTPAEGEVFRATLARYMRERCRNSQSEAARRLGCSQAHISNLIRGKTGPGLTLMRALAADLGCRVADVVSAPAAPAQLPLPSAGTLADRLARIEVLRGEVASAEARLAEACADLAAFAKAGGR